MVYLDFQVKYSSDAIAAANNISNISTDLLFPLSWRMGMTQYDPQSPFVASAGEMTMFIDNSSSDFTWSPNGGLFTDHGFNANLVVLMSIDTDFTDSDTTTAIFQGKVVEWYPEPGLFESRVTRAVLRDGMYTLSSLTASGLGVEVNQNAGDAMSQVINNRIGVDFYSSTDISINTTSFPVSFYDVANNQTRLLTAAGKVAKSDFGHLYFERIGPVTTRGLFQFTYCTRDEWIDKGTDLVTFSNQWLALDFAGQTDRLTYFPTNVTYNPTTYADTNVVIFEYNTFPTIKPGETWESIANYRDPDNKSSFVGVIDSDIVTPVSGTDYVVTGVASSDLSVTLTNLGSAGKYTIINNGGANATFTTLQIRGKPVLQYDNVTLTNASTDAATYEHTFNYDMPYCQDDAYAQSVLDFNATANLQNLDLIRSITFQAGVDSDTFEIARTARIGDFVHIIEDVNSIDEDYRIIGWDWLINSCEDIEVTFYVHPDRYFANRFYDSDGAFFTDSNGDYFAAWR